MNNSIVRKIVEVSSVATLPSLWDFLTPAFLMRYLEKSGEKMLQTLREGCDDKDLEANRILVYDGNGEPICNPVLDCNFGLLLCRKKSEEYFDLINQKGALVSSYPPLVLAHRDFYTQHRCSKTGLIFVAMNDFDLLVLRSLGLSVISSAGLSEVKGDFFRCCFGRCGDDSYPELNSISPGFKKCHYVFVAFDFANLNKEMHASISSIVERFASAERVYEIDTSERVSFWCPSSEEIEGIRMAAEFADTAIVRRHIFDSVSLTKRSVGQYEAQRKELAALPYATARAELLSLVEQTKGLGFVSRKIKEKLQAFNKSFGADVVGAIVADAGKACDPVERALLLLAADLMGNFHSGSNLVRSTEDIVGGRRGTSEVLNNPTQLNPEQLKEQLDVVNGLVKIHRSLSKNR